MDRIPITMVGARPVETSPYMVLIRQRSTVIILDAQHSYGTSPFETIIFGYRPDVATGCKGKS